MIDLFYTTASPVLQLLADALGGFIASLGTDRVADLLRLFVSILAP